MKTGVDLLQMRLRRARPDGCVEARKGRRRPGLPAILSKMWNPNSTMHRMLLSGLAPLTSMAAIVLLPFIARSLLADNDYAMWALMSTVATAGLTFDFGGTFYVSANLGDARAPRQVLRRGLAATVLGSVLIGILGCAAWLVLAAHRGIDGWSSTAGLLAIAFCGVGATVRSALFVYAAAALVYKHHLVRTSLLVSQAVLQLVIATVLMALLRTAWALPMSLLLSSLIGMVVAFRFVRMEARDTRVSADVTTHNDALSSFVSGRTAVGLLTTFISQVDRWVISAIGGAVAVANYEVAWRLAVMPKLAAIAVNQIVVAEVARARRPKSDGGGLRRLSADAFRTTKLVLFLGVPAVCLLALATLNRMVNPELGGSGLMFVALLIGHSVHALTAPGTMILNGLRRPFAEIPYLVLAAVVAALGWFIAFRISSTEVAYLTVSISLVVGSTYFLIRQRRTLSLEGGR